MMRIVFRPIGSIDGGKVYTEIRAAEPTDCRGPAKLSRIELLQDHCIVAFLWAACAFLNLPKMTSFVMLVKVIVP